MSSVKGLISRSIWRYSVGVGWLQDIGKVVTAIQASAFALDELSGAIENPACGGRKPQELVFF
ncbi:hypothetical protein A9Q89_08435 [Gammaproteobacteria bacterium 53_120_T64]|nr:hypothetical protein A9Q89_08435 [Gammaproteobacteria bacterium 53_120_T64]